MIPRRLTLKGLYSYRSEQTIDFERLVEARLFGIFGAVGSGKSSILEAISFALYGETERLHSQDSRSYNMMNLKSNDLLIRFEFESYGAYAGIYQFEVSGRRNSKQFAKVAAFKRRHLKWQDEDWVPIDETAEEIIGLSYDNFRRAIIIPQGKFQEFLQLKGKDRTEMMKELFELQRFDLHWKTRQLQGENSTVLSRMQGQLQELQWASDALLREKKKEEKGLKKEVKAQEKRLEEREVREKDYHTLQAAFAELTELEREAPEWAGRDKTMRERDALLADYRQCVLEFKPIMGRLAELQSTLHDAEERIAEGKDSLAESEKNLKAELAAFDDVASEYKQRDQLLEKVAQLKTMIEMGDSARQLRDLTADVEAVQAERATVEAQFNDLQSQQKTTVERLDSLRQARSTLADLIQLRFRAEETQRLRDDLKREEEEIELLQAAIARMKEQNTQGTAKDVQKAAIQELSTILERAETQVERRHGQIATQPATDDLSILENSDSQSLDDIDTHIEEAEVSRDDLGKACQELQVRIQQHDERLKSLEENRIKVDAAIGTARKQAGEVEMGDIVDLDETALSEEIKSLQNEHEAIGANFEDKERLINETRQQLERLKGELDVRSKQQTIDQELQAKLNGDLKQKIADSRYPSIGAVADILDRDIDIEQESAEIAEFDKQLHARNERLSALQAATKDKQYDADEHQQLRTAIVEDKNAVAEMNRRLGGLSTEVAKLETDLAARKELEVKLQEKQDRAENLKTLERLFKANGFVNYVSSVYLQELCHAANERFQKLTRRQLRLEVTENNTFQVRDFLNDGQVRSAKTLSGGQTFQASLSLALALSDNVQRLAGAKQNFFFLDEGFGTLDGEALRTVIDTLKKLRKENRIVGLISHVEALQDEIDVSLRITNDEEKGSEVH